MSVQIYSRYPGGCPLRKDERQTIRELVPKVGMSETARRLGRTLDCVRNLCRAEGIESPLKARYRPLEPYELDAIRELVPKVGCGGASRHIGRDIETVRRYAIQMGVRPPRKPIHGWPDDKIEALKQRWKTQTASQIGAVIGRSRSAVCGMARRLGLPSKPYAGFRDLRVVERVLARKSKKRKTHSAWIRRQAAAFIEWRRENGFQ